MSNPCRSSHPSRLRIGDAAIAGIVEDPALLQHDVHAEGLAKGPDRREGADLKRGHRARFEVDQHRDLVFEIASMIRLHGTPGEHVPRLAADVPQKVDIVNAGGVKQPSAPVSPQPPAPPVPVVEPIDVDRHHPPEPAAVNHLGHLGVLGAQPPFVAHHELHAGRRRGLHHLVALLDVERHGFLAEDVLPGAGRRHGLRAVQMVGRRQQDRVGRGIGQNVGEGAVYGSLEAGGQAAGCRPVGIVATGDPVRLQLPDQPGHVRAEIPASHNRDRDSLHLPNPSLYGDATSEI